MIPSGPPFSAHGRSPSGSSPLGLGLAVLGGALVLLSCGLGLLSWAFLQAALENGTLSIWHSAFEFAKSGTVFVAGLTLLGQRQSRVLPWLAGVALLSGPIGLSIGLLTIGVLALEVGVQAMTPKKRVPGSQVAE